MPLDEEEFICMDELNGMPFSGGAASPSSQPSATYPINGIRVKFPFKPYPSQIGIIDRMIRALNGDKQHALLESPTGSGKTMALLCGALSWMEEQRATRNVVNYNIAPLVKSGDDESDVQVHPFFAPRKTQLDSAGIFSVDDDTDQDFAAFDDVVATQETCNSPSVPNPATPGCAGCPSNKIKTPTKPKGEPYVMPKVYFTSRTHKQIAQVIRELRRCGYSAKFTVLASRTHYCINSAVRKALDINEACKDALSVKAATGRCMYVNRLTRVIDPLGPFSTNMDVEELVEYGKKERVCPYYVAREAAEYAEIIMCPYNYIIEPSIRDAMGIDLEGAVIIVDEAHNVEDVCRNAGSVELTHDIVFSIVHLPLSDANLLSVAIEQDIKSLFVNAEKGSPIAESACHSSMLHVCSIMLNWMIGISNFGSAVSTATNRQSSFETRIDIYEGKDIMSEFQKLGITEKTVKRWWEELELIEEAERKQSGIRVREDYEEDPLPLIQQHCLSSGACRILGGLFRTLDSIIADNWRNLPAFRLVKYETYKSGTRARIHLSNSNCVDGHGGRRAETVMGFWCLSSDVIFRPIAEQAKAIILTSGTLSPMDTFTSELQTTFPLQLEANHVIDPSQIFVGTFPRGPDGMELIGTYQNTNSFAFLDSISQAIYDICMVTPFGVLCFLPSYALLERLVERMESTGMTRRLTRIKEMLCEPRAGSAQDFEKLIKKYYGIISKCRENQNNSTSGAPSVGSTGGAIFFAVYRGKVSEGLDFADEKARAVINIGIPYPAFKDPKVTLKKEYNDRHAAERRLLSGMQWYETQAFRALNQALGRCIRHRNDWGAVIFLEQRFTQPRNIQRLSKWVRPAVKQYAGFAAGIDALRQFMRSKGSVLPEDHILPDASHNSRKCITITDESESDEVTISDKKPPSARYFPSRGGRTLGTRFKRPHPSDSSG